MKALNGRRTKKHRRVKLADILAFAGLICVLIGVFLVFTVIVINCTI